MDDLIKKFIDKIPKAELHVHLEGSITMDLLKKMTNARGHPYPSPTDQPFDVFNKCHDILSYNFEHNMGILLEYIFEDRRRQNIIYTQFQYSALKVNSSSGLELQQQFDIIIGHCERIKLNPLYNQIYIDFILDIPRGNAFTYRYLDKYVQDIIRLGTDLTKKYCYYVKGIGIGGRMENMTMDTYKKIFTDVNAAGLFVVPHAGEFCDNKTVCDNLVNTLDYNIARIGHGIRLVNCILEKPKLQRILTDKIPLDICISSNLQFINEEYSMECYPSKFGKKYTLKTHPIKQLIDSGYYITLSTDDPGILYKDGPNKEPIDLCYEYYLLSTLYDSQENKINIISTIAQNGIGAIRIPPAQMAHQNIKHKYTAMLGYIEYIKKLKKEHLKKIIKQVAGSINYYNKYLKYKQKYIALKILQ